MRHFQAPLAIAALSRGMPASSPQRALVARPGSAYRLPPCELGAFPWAVQVPAIALRADAHLHPAAAAVVEPVGCRLREQPQDPSPSDWTAPGRARHKGPAKPPPKALRIEGPGCWMPIKRPRAFVLFASVSLSITKPRQAGSPRAHRGGAALKLSESFCPAQSGPGRRRYRFAVARTKTIEIKIEEKETNAGKGCSDQEAHPNPRNQAVPDHRSQGAPAGCRMGCCARDVSNSDWVCQECALVCLGSGRFWCVDGRVVVSRTLCLEPDRDSTL